VVSQSPYEDVPAATSRRTAGLAEVTCVRGAEGASAEGISVSSSRRELAERQAYPPRGRIGAECANAHPATLLTTPLVTMTRSTRYEAVTKPSKGMSHPIPTVGSGRD
jgi:hypothetical protein